VHVRWWQEAESYASSNFGQLSLRVPAIPKGTRDACQASRYYAPANLDRAVVHMISPSRPNRDGRKLPARGRWAASSHSRDTIPHRAAAALRVAFGQAEIDVERQSA